MSRRFVVIAGLLSLALAGRGAAQDSVRIIVNATNPGSQIKREALQTIYLHTGARWADGRLVDVVDQSARSAVRAAFCEEALRQNLQSVQAQWTQTILTGKGAPPPVRPTDQEVIAFVASKPNAIGYVSAAATLEPGVKVLRVVE